MLSDIISNHLLMNALLAWATAQLLKFFIYLAVNRTIDWKRHTLPYWLSWPPSP